MDFDFSKLGNMKDMLDKAKNFQENLKVMKEKLDNTTFKGESGGGMVEVLITGAKNVKKIEIAEICLQDKKMMEDLIVAAMNNALKKIEEEYNTQLNSFPGLPNLPNIGF
mgnify:CR=1 FL=1